MEGWIKMTTMNEKFILVDFEEISRLKKQCYLIPPNYESDLATCYGWPDECGNCEIPRYDKNVKIELTKLQLGMAH